MSDEPPAEYATLVFDDDQEEGLVRFRDGFADLPPIIRLDYLQDWIKLLTAEYRRVVIEDHPDRHIDERQAIPVGDFLSSAIVPRRPC